jgi:predicted RNase H-like nuclease (RuvC/YqgF family)
MSETPLSEVFSTEADTKIVEEQPEKATEQEPVTDEQPNEEAQAESEAEAAPSAEDKPKDVSSEIDQLRNELNAFKTKAMDERNKRQDLQRQLEQEKPDAYVEPDKAIDYGINGLKTEFENRFLNMSEFNARSRHSEDFDDMAEVFFNGTIEIKMTFHS